MLLLMILLLMVLMIMLLMMTDDHDHADNYNDDDGDGGDGRPRTCDVAAWHSRWSHDLHSLHGSNCHDEGSVAPSSSQSFAIIAISLPLLSPGRPRNAFDDALVALAVILCCPRVIIPLPTSPTTLTQANILHRFRTIIYVYFSIYLYIDIHIYRYIILLLRITITHKWTN